MRIARVDLVGTTDVNGKATIKVPMPFTGAWYNLKFSLGLSAPAEWAINVSGTDVTYGRGRRVTLGPELIQDGERVTVTVTGGPPNAPILGSANGTAGTPEEILANYAAQPNTIALDTVAPRQILRPVTVTTTLATPSFTVASGALSGAQIFTVTPGCIALRILVTANGLVFKYNLLVLGRQSNVQYFGAVTAPGSSAAVPSPTLPITVPIDTDWDTQVQINVENPTQAVSVFVTALFDVEAPGQAGAAQSVIIPTAAPWQAPLAQPVEIRSAMASGATLVLVPAVAGQTVYCHDFHLISDAAVAAIEWQDTSGVAFGATRLAPAGDNVAGTFGGAPLTNGLGVQINNFSGAAINVWGHLTYSQQ